MEEQALTLALKISGHVGHPLAFAAFAMLIAALAFALALRAKQLLLAMIVAAGIVVLGVAPYAASTFLQSRGVYHIQVIVLDPDQSPVEIAQVKSSNGGELKMAGGGWELDIPRQSRPANGEITLTASVKDEFLKGASTLVLDRDYYPTVTIQLVANSSAKVRGVVVDEELRAVAGATVSIAGNPEVAVTDEKGNFVLPAHPVKQGQMIEIEAQKGQLTGHVSAPAGKVVEIILTSE